MQHKTNKAKQHISARFHAAAPTYDLQPGVQPAVAERVADMVSASNCLQYGDSPRILEVGCGTGSLTALLTARYPHTKILAVDIAPSMIEQARKRLGAPEQVTWETSDVQHLEIEPGSLSLITSSSALHWVQPLQPALEKLAGGLKPNGKLICGLMVEGTLAELRSLRREIAPQKTAGVELPGKDHVIGAMLAAGFNVTTAHDKELIARYPSATDFLRALNRQGVTGGLYAPHQRLNRSELKQLMDEYETQYAHPEGGVIATYRVLFAEADNTGRL